MRHVIAIAMIASLCGCEDEPAETPSASPASGTTTETTEAPTPDEPAEPSAPPGCRMMPEGGVLIATDGKKARPLIGEGGVAVLYEPRTRPWLEDNDEAYLCTKARGVSFTALPLGGEVRQVQAAACGYQTSIDLRRLGEDLAAVGCDTDGSESVCFVKWANPRDGLPQLRIEHLILDEPLIFAVDRSGDALFAAVTTVDGGDVTGYRSAAGGATERGRLGAFPTTLLPDELELAYLTVDAESEAEAVVHFGTTRAPHVLRASIGEDGHRTGDPPTRVERPAPPAQVRPWSVVVEREARRAPPRLRFVASEGTAGRAIDGIDAEADAFGAAAIEAGERHLLAWSEGLMEATRVKVAVFDPETGGIVGPITQLSTGEREGGYAALDHHANQTVVTWDEKNGEIWEVRAAALDCH